MDAPHGRWLNGWRKSLTAITQEWCEQYWTSPGYNTPQSSSYTATYHPSPKLSKLDKLDMQDTAGEVGTNSWVMYSFGPLHMDEQRQDNQFEPTYSSSVPIRDVALRICRKQWTIGRFGERNSNSTFFSILIFLTFKRESSYHSSCTATNHPSRKLSKLNEPDMRTLLEK